MARENIIALDEVRAAWLAEPMLQRLLGALAEAGGEGRVAGGAVRNALLGRAISDIDIATTLTPDVVGEVAARAGFSVHPTGIEHGTVTVAGHDGAATHTFEVTTLRADVETDGRRAVVRFTDDWALDAERRDLTINALYCDGAGRVHDYVGGLSDIVAGKVRFVGDAERRIREDYLRILRFFRFHAWYGRGRLDRIGLAACGELRHGLGRLSKERVGTEMQKLLAAGDPVVAVRAMVRFAILGELIAGKADVTRLKRVVDIETALAEAPDPLRRLAALLPGAQAQDLRQAFRLSNAQTARLESALEVPPLSPALRASERKAMLYRMTPQSWRDAVILAWSRSRAEAESDAWRDLFELPAGWSAPRFPLRGRDLIGAGLEPGPAISGLLEGLEDWWIANDFKPDQGELLARAKRLHDG